MKRRSTILGALTLSLPVLLSACSDEAPPRQVGTTPGERVTPARHQQPFGGVIGNTISESVAGWPDPVRAPEGAPNILLIMLDDVGFA